MAEVSEPSRLYMGAAHVLVLAAVVCLVSAAAFWDAHWLVYGGLSVACAIALASIASTP